MTERMVEVGTAAAVVAFVLALSRMIATSIAGPYPELFVGSVGGVWWGIFGALIAVAFGTYFTALAHYIIEAVKPVGERQ
jgi:hypothetical protein